MSEFFNMGGYAGYVWPAYAISVAVLGALGGMIFYRRRRLQKQIERMSGAKNEQSVRANADNKF